MISFIDVVVILINIALALYIIFIVPIRENNAREQAMESTEDLLGLSGKQLERSEIEIARLLSETNRLFKRVDKLEEDNQRRIRMEVRQAIEISELERVIGEYAAGVRIIINQLEGAGIKAAWDIPSEERYKTYIKNRVEREGFDRNDLFHKMDRHLTDTDLKELCFSVNVNYSNIPGNTHKEKIMGLIDYVSRDNRIGELMLMLRRIRPGIKW